MRSALVVDVSCCAAQHVQAKTRYTGTWVYRHMCERTKVSQRTNEDCLSVARVDLRALSDANGRRARHGRWLDAVMWRCRLSRDAVTLALACFACLPACWLGCLPGSPQ